MQLLVLCLNFWEIKQVAEDAAADRYGRGEAVGSLFVKRFKLETLHETATQFGR